MESKKHIENFVTLHFISVFFFYSLCSFSSFIRYWQAKTLVLAVNYDYILCMHSALLAEQQLQRRFSCSLINIRKKITLNVCGGWARMCLPLKHAIQIEINSMKCSNSHHFLNKPFIFLRNKIHIDSFKQWIVLACIYQTTVCADGWQSSKSYLVPTTNHFVGIFQYFYWKQFSLSICCERVVLMFFDNDFMPFFPLLTFCFPFGSKCVSLLFAIVFKWCIFLIFVA